MALPHITLKSCPKGYTRDLDIAGARIPVTASYTVNPYARTSFLNAGVGVKF